VTVTASAPDVIPWNTAVTLVEPLARAVRRPREPLAFETDATVAVDDNQVAAAVRSYEVESLYKPVAVSCWLPPRATDSGLGVMVIDERVALLTVSVLVPDTPR